jgi:hypothetical protein
MSEPALNNDDIDHGYQDKQRLFDECWCFHHLQKVEFHKAALGFLFL